MPFNYIIGGLAKEKFRLFNVAYNRHYVNFFPQYILRDNNHPLWLRYRRIDSQRRKTGLWWSTTCGTELGKKSLIRHWLGRRLRNAFSDELRIRGISENGKFLPHAKLHTDVLRVALERGEELNLTGSLRLMAGPLLMTAKYEDVRKEAGKLVDILVNGFSKNLMDKKFDGKSQDVQQSFGNKADRVQPNPRAPRAWNTRQAPRSNSPPRFRRVEEFDRVL